MLSIILSITVLEARIFTPSVRPTEGPPKPRGPPSVWPACGAGRSGETLPANHLRAHGQTTPLPRLSHGRLEWVQQGLAEHDRLWLAARRTESLLEQCHLCGWTAGNCSTERKPWNYSRLPKPAPFTWAVQAPTLCHTSVVLSPGSFYSFGFTVVPLDRFMFKELLFVTPQSQGIKCIWSLLVCKRIS